ncbi:MAG: DUF4358 domain-containing protein [Longicatena sp.]
MRKIVYVLGLCLLSLACIYPFLRVRPQVATKEVETQLVKLANTKEFKKEDLAFLRKNYNLHASDYSYTSIYGSVSAMEVNEIACIRVIDKSQKETVLKSLKKRQDDQYKAFQGYAPRQSKLVKEGQIFEMGDYVFLLIHQDAKGMQEQIEDLY